MTDKSIDERLTDLDDAYRARLGHDESLHSELAAIMTRVLECESRLDAVEEHIVPRRGRAPKGRTR